MSRFADDQTPAPTPANTDESLADSLYQRLVYGLSIPERTVRSAVALASGAAGESAAILVPRVFQDSKSYRVFVQQMIDTLSYDVGGVKKQNSDDPNSTPPVENYVAKKTVGTFIDLAGMSLMHVSPLTVLAVVSDVAHGSKFYLQELAQELKLQGVIDQESTIDSTAQLLQAIGDASGNTADEFDTPPIDIQGLTDTIQRTQQELTKIDPTQLIPQSEIKSFWNDMNQMASAEKVSLFQLSSAMTMYSLDQVSNATKGTLVTIRVTGDLLDRHFFDHYRDAMDKISEIGIYGMLTTTSQRYLDAVWFNFSDGRATLTQDFFSGKLIGQAVQGLAGWLGLDGSSPEDNEAEKPAE